jgi:hypothetical protein
MGGEVGNETGDRRRETGVRDALRRAGARDVGVSSFLTLAIA